MKAAPVAVKVGKAAVPVAAIAAVLVAVLGPNAHGLNGAQIAQYVAAVLAGMTAVVHAPTVKKIVKPRPRPRPPAEFTMYDTITVQTVPPHPQAVAGYVGGFWPTYRELVALYPKAKHLSIAVNAHEDADCLDIENGDAVPAQAPGWCKRQHNRGIHRPCVYSSISEMPTVLRELANAGIHRSQVRVWTAHYTGRPHRCTAACGFGFNTIADATQYTDRALERNLDASLCAGTFL